MVELAELDGDWHEFESKALRKEKEKQDKEARRRDREQKEVEKRAAEDASSDLLVSDYSRAGASYLT